MMLKRLTIIVGVLCLLGTYAHAQKAQLKRAAGYMEELNYVGAIQVYNQVLDKHDNAEAKINLAEAYRKVGDTENAEFWLGQVVRLPESKPIHKLHYGQALQSNGKCEMAREWYQTFIEEVPGDLRGQYLVKACDYENELRTKNGDIYDIRHLDFNSNLDDFGPTMYKGKLVFASERDKGSAVKRAHCWTGNPFLELYQVEVNESSDDECCTSAQFGRPEKYDQDLNSKYHDASITVSDDESTVFFTRNNYKDGKTGQSDDGIVKLKVYYRADGGEITSLPFNSDEYSVAHPTLAVEDNKLYFSSDMPGGFGGMDLYVSENENGRWGPPMNLGPNINTEGNEVFPSYDRNFEKLYFSSDGHIGLGGLDLYVMDDKGEGEWGEIENLGFPLNTESDDFGIILNEKGTCGYFSSDRDGGFGRDDIYCFRKTASPVEILVYDELTGDPLEGATVLNACTEATKETDASGKVRYDMKMDLCCEFNATLEGYLPGDEEACTKNIMVGDPVFIEIPLKRELDCIVSGVIFDQNTGEPLEGAEVSMINSCGKNDPESVMTDASGAYEFMLDTECCYKISASLSGYFGTPVENQCSDCVTESTNLKADIYLSPTTVTSSTRDVITGTPSNTDPVISSGAVTSSGTVISPSETVIVGAPTNVYLDLDQCLYIDSDTGLPANLERPGGVTYRSGNRFVDGAKQTPDCSATYVSESYNTGFEVSPSVSIVEEGAPVPYLLHIYYDFDQSYIRNEAKTDLNKLCKLLTDNPNLIVEIGSHTDARGSYSYNLRLSQRRADAVVKWLNKNCGISRNRLIPRGYGEEVHVNNCKNNIPCSEKEHQFNRRTEFRILGCVGDENIQVSKAKPSPKVDPCQGCPF